MPIERNEAILPPDGGIYGNMLADLESVVEQVLRETPHSGDDSTALLRILKGVPLETWERCASTYGLDNWLALPLQHGRAEAVAKMLEVQQRLAFQRDHDALTGIGNRGYFNRRLDEEVSRAMRSHTELSLMLIDLDNFKQVNDRYGHACGDRVLQGMAKLLQNSVRHYDITARIGGEEFAAILPATTVWTGVMLGNRLLDSFRKECFTCNGEDFSMAFSGGVSTLSLLDGERKNGACLMESADKAMYEAKRNGKNSVTAALNERLNKDRTSLVHAGEKQLLFAAVDGE
ncbi:MAG: GGDEF domain-containing protein [Desulfovibrio sp.]|jgi:diguanylate cyclase (GGDEF)-like protein|nr:GGDEF domain-containing protein [Desulfovibrio sp.]